MRGPSQAFSDVFPGSLPSSWWHTCGSPSPSTPRPESSSSASTASLTRWAPATPITMQGRAPLKTSASISGPDFLSGDQAIQHHRGGGLARVETGGMQSEGSPVSVATPQSLLLGNWASSPLLNALCAAHHQIFLFMLAPCHFLPPFPFPFLWHVVQTLPPGTHLLCTRNLGLPSCSAIHHSEHNLPPPTLPVHQCSQPTLLLSGALVPTHPSYPLRQHSTLF